MNRRTFLKLAAAGAAVLAMPKGLARGASAPAAEGRRPNVVIFLTDDQGFGDLGFHGNPKVATPHMDAFAQQAVELTQFYVMPVCSPTRASLMTGRYHLRTGIVDVFGAASNMKAEEVTLAEALRPAGYATGIFGKWHLGASPLTQGFDEALTFDGPGLRKYFDPTLIHNGRAKEFKGYCTDIFVDHAIDFLRRNKDKPFFLYLPTNLIHTPLQVSDTYVEPFAQAGLNTPTSKVYGMLKNVDDNFGRVLGALRELGLEDNTFLLFASDNGPCTGSTTTQRFMASLRGLKGTVYENGIRVPCFVRWPQRLRPAKVDRIAAAIDVMPTVLEVCGVEKPAAVKWDGTSLLPLLLRPDAPWPDRTLFFQWEGYAEPHRGMAFAVRSPRYKLVQAVGIAERQAHIAAKYSELCKAQGRGELALAAKTPKYELFDIEKDPGETVDLAPQHPEIVEQMKKQYEVWFDDVWTRWHKSGP